MCGISGIIRWNKITELDLNRMNKSLLGTNYRGPDNKGLYVDDFAVLGHNRLSIIDLSSDANQPIKSLDGRYYIVFNGEIYNFNELKVELQNLGYNFKTTSDTEVVLSAYIHYGKNVCAKLRGMFAFAIWDNILNVLFLSRDRFGEKPLYYHYNQIGKKIFFSSDLNGLRSLMDFEPTINSLSVYSLIQQQYIDTDICIYNEVNKMPPSSYFLLKDGGNIEIENYWQPNYLTNLSDTFLDVKYKTKELLFKIVEEQLVSDAPIGVFLSGGVDSSVIAAIAKEIKNDISAITLSVSEDNAYDEGEIASKMAHKIGIKHKLIPVSDNCILELPNLLSHIEPLADSSILPSALIAKAANEDGFKVMLTGDGGDEIFGGYKRPLLISDIANKRKFGIIKFLIDQALTNPSYDFIWKRLTTNRLISYGNIDQYFTKNNISPLIASELFLNKYDKFLGTKWLSEAKKYCKNDYSLPFYINLKGQLVSDFLFKTDTSSMANSIETRSPFLDFRLQEFISQVPINNLMPNKIDKEVLKSIGNEYYSSEIMNLPKKGFSIPIRTYLLKSWNEKLLKYAKEGISEKYGLLSSNTIIKLVSKFRNNPENVILGKTLFSILVFEIWLRSFHLKGSYGGEI